MRAILYITIAISLAACAHLPSWAPQEPTVEKCSYSWKFQKFRCTNSETKKAFNRSLDNPKMEGAQALSIDDYNKGQAWLDELLSRARTYCQP